MDRKTVRQKRGALSKAVWLPESGLLPTWVEVAIYSRYLGGTGR